MSTNTYKINEITIEEKNRLYKKSIFNVENDPSKRGLTPNAIKEMLAGIVVDKDDSILALIEKIIMEQNIVNARVDLRISEIDGSGGGLGVSLADWVLKSSLDVNDIPKIPISKVDGINPIVDEIQRVNQELIINVTLNTNEINALKERINNIEVGKEGTIIIETLEEANASPKAKKAGSIAFIKM